jgi:hypothetical protein
MAICNVFKELTKSNGTFFTFSQYAEDLTKHQSNPSYKVIPSRFICCDVDYSSFGNKTLPNLLQNNFENGCSFLRDKLDNWTPEISKNLFWNEIGEKLLLSDNSNSIVYCGDINIQSYSEQDNIGYNEIYCYIPNDAKKMSFSVTESGEQSEGKQYNGEYICGYDSNDLNFTGLLDIEHVYPFRDSLGLKDYNYRYDNKYNIDLSSYTYTTDTSFKFNTVVVFYNIYSNGDIKYKNIPLGMFVTGTIYEGKMGGEITKYVNNGDIYYSGTSYGLRICSRFVVSPNSTELQDTTVNSEEDGDYPALAQVMSAMTDSQSKMDEVINSIHNYQDGIKGHLAQFKDGRVNIPYIRYINEVPYWFVNGKNTDVPVWGGIEALQTNVDELNKTVNDNTTNVRDLQITVGEIVDGVIKFENIGEYNYKAGEQVKSIILKSHLLPGTYSIQEIGSAVLSGNLFGENPMGLSLILRDYNISDDNGVNDVVIDVINVEKNVQFTSTRPFALEICPVNSEFLKTYYGSEDKESLKNNLQASLTGFTVIYPNITIQKITEKFIEREL